MKPWWDDLIPLTWGAVLEAALMSMAGCALALAILWCVIWIAVQ